MTSEERAAKVLADIESRDGCVPPPYSKRAIAAAIRSSTVVSLARSMRATSDYSTLRILGDALEESGIEDEAWLRHCREPRPRLCPECEGHTVRVKPHASGVSGQGWIYEDCTACRGVGTTPRSSSWVVSAIIGAVGDPGEHPLRAVCEEPGSDAARLAVPGLAEFAQVQCELANLPPEPKMTCSGMKFWTHHAAQAHSRQCKWCQWTDIRDAKILPLRCRERELWPMAYQKTMPIETHRTLFGGDATEVGPCYERNANVGIVWRRGFPAELTCTWQEWQTHHADWWWSPLQTVECPQWGYDEGERHHLCAKCRGSGRVPRPFPMGERECPGEPEYPDFQCRNGVILAGDGSQRCTNCHGTGRVPGEPSVMPLEVVRLTEVTMDYLPGESMRISIDRWHQHCRQMWPGLKFDTSGN
jgi:hypothetical protein